jgi:predicted dehydrogenase
MLPGSPFAGCAWREEKGALWDLGPHALSVLLPVLGPVVKASATRDVHGVTALALRHADGATSTSMLTFHAAAPDRIEAYEFSAGTRTERIDITPAPRQPCFAAAVTDLLQAIADPPARQGGCGVELASEVVTILSEAERCVSAWKKDPLEG